MSSGAAAHGCTVLVGTLLAMATGLASRASAQAPEAQAPAEAPPGTITLDRMDASARVGVQIGFDKIDRISPSDGFGMRYDFYGQGVLPNEIVGVYGQLPFSHVFDFNGSDATGVGNFDLGAFFLPTHRSDVIIRAGLALPIASDGGDGEAANALTTFERLTDLLLIAPSYTTLRLSVSTVDEVGTAFFRGDLGLDLAIHKPSGGSGVFLRANAAAGIRVPSVDLTVELVNVGVLDGNVQGGITDRFIHTAAIGLRTRGADQLGLGMVFPLDQATRGEIWIVSLGYQRAFTP